MYTENKWKCANAKSTPIKNAFSENNSQCWFIQGFLDISTEKKINIFFSYFIILILVFTV